MRRASAEPWWDSTLMILVADHGSRHPGASPIHVPEKFHIPMIWLGGALNQTDTVISKVLNQSDIPTLICDQLGISNSEFTFGKDVLSGSPEFAIYAYNNGYGFVTENEQFTYDLESSKLSDSEVCDSIVMQSQAFLQTLLHDFNQK